MKIDICFDTQNVFKTLYEHMYWGEYRTVLWWEKKIWVNSLNTTYLPIPK